MVNQRTGADGSVLRRHGGVHFLPQTLQKWQKLIGTCLTQSGRSPAQKAR